MLSINMDDVMQVVSNIQNYLIAFGVVLVLALLVMFAVRKMPKAKKKMIRAQSGLAILLALAIVVNLICTGPMSTMLDLVSGEGSISEETSAEATELVNEITQEGIVLAQNDDNILPVASGSKLNVFGWASTSPCYGGTGSGALNDAYPVTDLLTGLHDAGIETNDELSKFYTDYCSTRPSVGMAQQDWTLPEPNVSLYTDEMMANAKAYSDTAMVVITRVGGEGADLPTDMSAVVDGSWVRRVADYRGSQRGAGYYNGTYDDTLNEGNDWDKGDHFLQLSNREEELIDLVTSNFDNVIVVYNGANAFEMDWVKNYPQIKGVLLCPGTGQSGFEGFGRVVAGEVNPSGRTADTYAADLTASPWWNNFGDFKYTNASEFNSNASMFDPEGTTPSFVNYVEGIYVGYKFYETAADEGLIDYDKEVVYPFGYGLSYTTFAYSDLKADADKVTFTISNTGSRAGAEIAQLYVAKADAAVFRPEKELKGFAKVFLQAGECKTVTIPLDDKAFRYWNVKTDRWETEGGSYQLLVGASVQDIRLRAEVPVQGTGAPDPYAGKAVQCYRTADIKNVPDAAFEALLGHAIPEDKPHIDQTMTLGELNHSRSPLCWLAWAVLHTLLKRSSREGTPDLNLLFQYNMPVRALAQMTGGMVGQETVDGIVMEAKGFWIIGLLRALIGFGQNAVSNRKFRAALDAERGGPAV